MLGSLLLVSFLVWSFAAGGTSATRDDVDRLRGRDLQLPVAGVRPAELRDSFAESRGGHTHEAIDTQVTRCIDWPAVAELVSARVLCSA